MRPHPSAEPEAGAWRATGTRFSRRALLILWPAFVMAGVLETLVFVVVDPAALHWFGGAPLDWPVTAVYSVTFFIFWWVIAASGAITQLLDQPAGASRH